MTNAHIEIPGTTAFLQSYRNNIGGVAVDSEAVTLTRDDGTPVKNVMDPNNTTSTPLAAGGSFVGTATNILQYNQINFTVFGRPNILVSGDANDAEGSAYFEFSPDGTNWDISVPIVVRTLGIFIPYPLINVGQFFRIRYLNDGGASAITALGLNETAGIPRNQTVFRLNTYLLPNATKELARTLDQQIGGSDPVNVVRSVSTGKNPSGTFVNIPASGVLTNNSTTTPLLANGVFQGPFTDVSLYASIILLVNSDQASASNGVEFQFSNDGVTQHDSVAATYSISSAGQVFSSIVEAKYVRIKYTNGSVNQTTFSLQTIISTTSFGPPLRPVSSTLDNNSSATTARSVLAALITGTTNFTNLIATARNTLLAEPPTFKTVQTNIIPVGTSNSRLDGTPLAGRTAVEVLYPKSTAHQQGGTTDGVAWVGWASGSTQSGSMRELQPGESWRFDADATVAVYASANNAAQPITLTEFAP